MNAPGPEASTVFGSPLSFPQDHLFTEGQAGPVAPVTIQDTKYSPPFNDLLSSLGLSTGKPAITVAPQTEHIFTKVDLKV